MVELWKPLIWEQIEFDQALLSLPHPEVLQKTITHVSAFEATEDHISSTTLLNCYQTGSNSVSNCTFAYSNPLVNSASTEGMKPNENRQVAHGHSIDVVSPAFCHNKTAESQHMEVSNNLTAPNDILQNNDSIDEVNYDDFLDISDATTRLMNR